MHSFLGPFRLVFILTDFTFIDYFSDVCLHVFFGLPFLVTSKDALIYPLLVWRGGGTALA